MKLKTIYFQLNPALKKDCSMKKSMPSEGEMVLTDAHSQSLCKAHPKRESEVQATGRNFFTQIKIDLLTIKSKTERDLRTL
ncbi:hypothetical protein GFK26_12865 [Variovorax paradoxus]|uniref:Uncharacterized protein n=2 Tax=Variovorax paradoxus TaxID=34073 RepID=A0A5Q0M560_VARPD|nr:hypothetical protein GFK26_12865 [Variovorax paradoxus]